MFSASVSMRTGRGICGLVIVALAGSACSEYGAVAEHMVNRVFENAVAAVRSELPPPRAAALELRTTGTPGNGFYIYSVDRSGNPEFVWVFAREGHLYALGEEELALTPRIRVLADAPDEIQRDAGLFHLTRAEILHDVALHSQRGYISHPPSKTPA